MIAQLKQDLNNKSFSHQDQNNHDDGLQQRIKFGLIMFLMKEDQ